MSDAYGSGDYSLVPVDHDPFADALRANAGNLENPGNVTDAMRYGSAFAQGGLYGAAKAAGVSTPQWMDTVSRVAQNPDVNAALGTVMPSQPIRGVTAFKGLYPYDYKTVPEYFGSGKVVPGTESRIPQELTEINNPDRPYAGFFSSDPNVANRFASNLGNGAVMRANLNFENPLIIDAEGKPAVAFQFESVAREHGTQDDFKAFQNAWNGPHDGVVLKNTADEGDVYVPRLPNQITPSWVTAAKRPSITAYHGSPYDFSKFDLSKIGTGEGAQAYGHGLYFAEAEPTARSYRDATSDTLNWPVVGGNPDWNVPSWLGKKASSSPAALDESIADFQQRFKNLTEEGHWNAPRMQEIVDALQAVKAGKATFQPPGKMYQVSIAADPEHFLDWDKPLSEQHPAVQEKIAGEFGKSVTRLANEVAQGIDGRWYTLQNGEAVGNVRGWPDEGTANAALKVIQQQNLPAKSVQQWLQSSPGAESRMAQAGIPGIKYLDQGSRMTGGVDKIGDNYFVKGSMTPYATRAEAEAASKAAGNATHNFVVFDDSLISILKKYGLAGLIAGGASHFSTTPVDHDPYASGMAQGGRVGRKARVAAILQRHGIAA